MNCCKVSIHINVSVQYSRTSHPRGGVGWGGGGALPCSQDHFIFKVGYISIVGFDYSDWFYYGDGIIRST